MARITPIVRFDTLLYQHEGQDQSLNVGTPTWYAWLNTASTFAFTSEHGSFTARKEQPGNKRGGAYWKAYRMLGGKLRRAYLGKSEQLTLERLNAVAAELVVIAEVGQLRVSNRSLSVENRSILPLSMAVTLVSQTQLQPTPKHNLPEQLTSLVGREQEVATVSSLLRRHDARLLTLNGTGGVGKTRLALQGATALLNDFADGVFFVPLAPISDPSQMLPTIA